ncbi:hypothetical protein LCGC14_0398860 [marine sediment metagenome]|uniref:Uncharacterized protein n=1 Tax=marine sediment metagenome TaxID=412755 RepID=A0A0F9SXB8_9ZZZZ
MNPYLIFLVGIVIGLAMMVAVILWTWYLGR